MDNELHSLSEWQHSGNGFEAETIPLKLMQTYEEWLAENPNGVVCIDVDNEVLVENPYTSHSKAA
jgi:hypothetical protein